MNKQNQLQFVIVRKDGVTDEESMKDYKSILKELFYNNDDEGLKKEVSSIEKNKNNELYLVLCQNIPVGITGLYWGDEPNICWYNWYGVREEYRGNKFGQKIFEFTIELAKIRFQGIRLHTDDNCAIAISYIYDKYFDSKERVENNIIYSKSFLSNHQLADYNKAPFW